MDEGAFGVIYRRGQVQSAGRFRRGDVTGDGSVDLTDGVAVLNALFLGGSPLSCQDAADANDSGELDLTDGVLVLNFLFLGQGPPAPPGPGVCGSDPTADGLTCDSHPACE